MWDYQGRRAWDFTEGDGRCSKGMTAEEVRSARLVLLKMAIANGTYRVPVDRVAESMVRRSRGESPIAEEMYSV